MKEKTFKKVRPCGKLYVCAGLKEYFLLHPRPISKDSWQQDVQQTWLVVPNDSIGVNKDKTLMLYPMSRHLTTHIANVVVEVFDCQKEILVWDGEYIETNEVEDDNEE